MSWLNDVLREYALQVGAAVLTFAVGVVLLSCRKAILKRLSNVLGIPQLRSQLDHLTEMRRQQDELLSRVTKLEAELAKPGGPRMQDEKTIDGVCWGLPVGSTQWQTYCGACRARGEYVTADLIQLTIGWHVICKCKWKMRVLPHLFDNFRRGDFSAVTGSVRPGNA